MFAVSAHLFSRSAWPSLVATSSISSLSVRDLRAYSGLFKEVGLTVLQFKTLLSSRTLDWVDYDPNEVVELNGEYMHYLHTGHATCYSKHSLSIAERTQVSDRIFGDVQFAKALESRENKSNKKPCAMTKRASSMIAPRDSFLVDSNGASMLKISTTKLLQLMEHDDELFCSIQRLVLLCMQEKLSRSHEHQEIGQSCFNSDAMPSNSSSSIPNATPFVPAKIDDKLNCYQDWSI